MSNKTLAQNLLNKFVWTGLSGGTPLDEIDVLTQAFEDAHPEPSEEELTSEDHEVIDYLVQNGLAQTLEAFPSSTRVIERALSIYRANEKYYAHFAEADPR